MGLGAQQGTILIPVWGFLVLTQTSEAPPSLACGHPSELVWVST